MATSSRGFRASVAAVSTLEGSKSQRSMVVDTLGSLRPWEALLTAWVVQSVSPRVWTGAVHVVVPRGQGVSSLPMLPGWYSQLCCRMLICPEGFMMVSSAEMLVWVDFTNDCFTKIKTTVYSLAHTGRLLSCTSLHPCTRSALHTGGGVGELGGEGCGNLSGRLAGTV